jgi:hypothetical protein
MSEKYKLHASITLDKEVIHHANLPVSWSFPELYTTALDDNMFVVIEDEKGEFLTVDILNVNLTMWAPDWVKMKWHHRFKTLDEAIMCGIMEANKGVKPK